MTTPVLPDAVEEESAAEAPTSQEVDPGQFRHDALLLGHRIAAGLLCQAGAISVDEARAMSGIKPLSVRQRERILQQLRWMRDTGCVDLPVNLFDLFYEAQSG